MTAIADTASTPPRRERSMPTLLILAGKELREGFRNRWVLATTLLLAALALTLALLGSAPTGTVGANQSFTIPLTPSIIDGEPVPSSFQLTNVGSSVKFGTRTSIRRSPMWRLSNHDSNIGGPRFSVETWRAVLYCSNV